MAHLVTLKTFSDNRGHLTVLEKDVPFSIKRIFYIYGVDDSIRAGHRHVKTIQALICINGSCIVDNENGKEKIQVLLNEKEKCLILEPEDWHIVHSFSKDAILMVLASEYYDERDYIFEKYS